jgi:hypothetical protein
MILFICQMRLQARFAGRCVRTDIETTQDVPAVLPTLCTSISAAVEIANGAAVFITLLG